MTTNNQSTLKEMRQKEASLNYTMKLHSKMSLSGLYPAIRRVTEFVGYKDRFESYYIAANVYHALNDAAMIASIKYDKMMGKMKTEYKDQFGRIVKIFKTELAAKRFLINNNK